MWSGFVVGVRPRAPALLALALTLAACGARAQAPTDRQWVANAREVAEQLRGDVVLSSGAGTTVRSARHALRDDSSLFGLLIAYTDFGDCNAMVANLGVAPRRLAPVARTLRHACARLQRASSLFARAATDTDPSALLAAARTAQPALPLLVHAELGLR